MGAQPVRRSAPLRRVGRAPAGRRGGACQQSVRDQDQGAEQTKDQVNKDQDQLREEVEERSFGLSGHCWGSRGQRGPGARRGAQPDRRGTPLRKVGRAPAGRRGGACQRDLRQVHEINLRAHYASQGKEFPGDGFRSGRSV